MPSSFVENIYIKKGALTELQSRQLEKISHFKASDTKLKNHKIFQN